MKVFLFLTIFISTITFANEDIVEVVTGVDTISSKYPCDQIHNVKIACFKNNFKFISCHKGEPNKNGTISYIAKCDKSSNAISTFSTISSQPKECLKRAASHMGELSVCNIKNGTWNKFQDCYAHDQHQKRNSYCKLGCENIPQYHVCDWKESEYALYKNCTSLNSSIQTTRETLCPNGRPDVDNNTGPPPRVHIDGNRYSTKNSYLTFTPGFKVNINSIIGGKAELCISTSSKTCEKFDVLSNGLNGGAKYILDDKVMNFPNGTFSLYIKNSQNKKLTKLKITKIDKALAASQKETIKKLKKMKCEYSKGAGKWTELIGNEYSPVLRSSDTNSSEYVLNPTCDCIGEEQKDAYGRRWKCISENKKENEQIALELPKEPLICSDKQGEFCTITGKVVLWRCQCGKHTKDVLSQNYIFDQELSKYACHIKRLKTSCNDYTKEKKKPFKIGELKDFINYRDKNLYVSNYQEYQEYLAALKIYHQKSDGNYILSEDTTLKTFEDGSTLTQNFDDNTIVYKKNDLEVRTQNYDGSNDMAKLPGCGTEELKCNASGFKYYIKTCWGGEDPNDALGSSDSKWYAYIYPEQYIQYTTEQCYGSTVSSMN